MARVLGALDGPADLPAHDRALGANPQYAHARRIGQLAPLEDSPRGCDPGAGPDARVLAGQRLGDAKPGVLLPADAAVD